MSATTPNQNQPPTPDDDLAPVELVETLRVAAGVPKTEGPDPFDLSNLRVPPDYEHDAAVKKLLTHVPVRKPHRQEWVWVHPTYREVFMSIALKDENEVYLALPHVAAELSGEVQRRMFYLAQNASRVTFLWPVKVAAPGERLDAWSESAHDAAMKAIGQRIRMASNRSLGAYETFVTDNKPIGFEPKWPDLTFQELVKIAFRGGKLIDTFEHPVVKQIRGL